MKSTSLLASNLRTLRVWQLRWLLPKTEPQGTTWPCSPKLRENLLN